MTLPNAPWAEDAWSSRTKQAPEAQVRSSVAELPMRFNSSCCCYSNFVSAFQLDLLHRPWLLFQACTTVATWNDDTMYLHHFPRASYGPAENEHPTDQPKTSQKQQGHLFRRRCQSNGCGYENRGWREDHVDSFHSLVQRCAARCFVQQASLITVAQVPRILRQLCGFQWHIVALDGIRSFQAPTSEVMYQQEQLNLWRL